jgi:hypothetical protein
LDFRFYFERFFNYLFADSPSGKKYLKKSLIFNTKNEAFFQSGKRLNSWAKRLFQEESSFCLGVFPKKRVQISPF